MTLLTFADLRERDTVTLTIELDYGRVEQVRFAIPTRIQWFEDEYAEPDTPVPGASKGEANPYDVTYRKEQAGVISRRQARHLARALADGGMDLPGGDLEAKADALAETNAALFEALYQKLHRAVHGGKATADPDGDLFRAVRADQARRAEKIRALTPGVGGDVGAVEAPPAAGDAGASGVSGEPDRQDAGP